MALGIVGARSDLTVVQRIEGSGATNQMTIKIKGDRARIEATPEVTMIVNGKTGEIINVMNAEKKFLRISADKAKAVAEMVSKYGGAPDAAGKPKLTPSGRKETINGHEAAEYVSESASSKASYWIALNYPDGPAIMRQLQAVTPAAWHEVAKGMLDYRDLPGIPLRAQVRMSGKEMTSTIVSIRQDALSDTEFSPPKDFQEIKIPNVQGLPGQDSAPATSPNP
jgi:hypothetical protein